MHDQVAIRANGNKVVHGIQYVPGRQRVQRMDVVNADRLFSERAIHLFQVDIAHSTQWTMCPDALRPCHGFMLVPVHLDRQCMRTIRVFWSHFFWRSFKYNVHVARAATFTGYDLQQIGSSIGQ